MGETSDNQTGDRSNYDTDIKYGEWSQEQMEKFMNDFEVSKNIKRGKKEKVVADTPDVVITDEIAK
jgi:hypothetical protein